jgi:hypothetical protein
MRPGGRDGGQRGVDLGQVDALRGSGRHVVGLGDLRDLPDLTGRDRPRGERRLDRGQLLQCPPGAHHPGGLRWRQVPVSAQPRRHALQPVVLGRLRQLTLAHRARQQGGQLVAGGQQTAHAVVELRAGHR